MNASITYESRIGTLPRDQRYALQHLSPVECDRWNARLDHAAFHVVALDGDHIVGFAYAYNPWGTIGEKWNKHVPNALEFGGLIVDPNYRRLGIMSELVRLRLGMANAINRTPVCVTLSDNHSVISYYSSRGWTPRRQFQRDGDWLIPWVLQAESFIQKAGVV